MQPTLLIVDSDVFQQQLIDMLLAVDDYKLITATTGREALEHLKLLTPQLIMLADNLPDTKGADLCARIRGVRRFQHTPVILTSSADSAQDVASLVPAVDASVALAKPLGNKRLRDHVRDLIAATPTPITAAEPVSEQDEPRAVVKAEAHKPTLPETFESKDSDTVLGLQAEQPVTEPEDVTKPLSLEPGMSEEDYVRSILAKGSVVPIKEESVSKLSIFQDEASSSEPVPQEPATQKNELDEDLLLTEADLTELTIYTDMEIESNVSPVIFNEPRAVVKPAPSFTQPEAKAETKVPKEKKPIKLENFADDYDVRVTATRPKKLRSEDSAPLVTNTQTGETSVTVSADAPLEPKKPKRKLNTLIEQPFGAQPSKRALNAPKPSGKVLSDLVTDPALEIHDLADEDTRKRSAKHSSHNLDSKEALKKQELEQMSQQVEALLRENDQLKEAIRELESDKPVGTSESYLDAVEELEALRRLSEHQGRQLTKLYGENRYLREKQQEPLKPEPPRKTIWDKLKL